MIDEKKEELKSLIGFDGANNGKLGDTKFFEKFKNIRKYYTVFCNTFVIYAYAKNKYKLFENENNK